VALLAVANWLHHRNRKVAPVAESSDGAKEPVLID
jgi:AAT family amino acid transporter